ncbi:hypothetical protein OXX69_003939 [Metschnikowia pulcherrima]
MPNMSDISYIERLHTTAKSISAYQLSTFLVCFYLGCLLLMNLLPHLRVRSFGWLALCGVTFTLPDATITARRIRLRLNLSWRSSNPFRMVAIQLTDVVVVMTERSQEKGHTKNQAEKNEDSIREDFSFIISKFVYDYVIRRNWLNELTIQLYRVSFHHHAMEEDISFHIDYLKIENTYDSANSTEKFGVSVLDGYVNDTSPGGELAGLRLFHNLEVSVACDLIFSCPSQHSRSLQMSLSNIDALFVIADLRVRKLDQLIAKRKHQTETAQKHREIPSLRLIFDKLATFSSVQLKVEQSEIEFKEVKLASSSYSLNYSRDDSYKQQTTAKFSSYVTAATLFHNDSKCLDVPSIAYILDVDLTDFYRAKQSKTIDDFTVDLLTTLSMTNPSFYVYFDQFAYILEVPLTSEASGKSDYDIKQELMTYTKHIRKSSVKFVVVDLKGQLHMPDSEGGDFRRESMKNVVSIAGAQAMAFKFSSKNLGDLLNRKCSSSSPVSLKSFFKLRNLYMEVEGNKVFLSALSALIGYSLDSHKVALRISSKRLQLKSVNTMIFHIVRKIREAQIGSANKACRRMNEEREANEFNDAKSNVEVKRELIDIFEILPPIIHSVKLRAVVLSSDIICNDWLPSHVFHDDHLGEDIDLADFKRGVSLTASGLELDYKRGDKYFETRMRQLQVNTLSECASEYVEDFDQKTSDPLAEIEVSDVSSLESGLSEFSSNAARENVKTVKKVLNVQDVLLRNPSNNSSKLMLSVPQVEARADIYLVWCILYAYTLVEIIAPRVERTYSHEEAQRLKSVRKIIEFDTEISSLSLVTRLPHDVDVLFEIDSLSLRDAFTSPQCQASYVRLYVIHPTTKLWSRLISVTDMNVDLDMISRNSISVKTRALRFNIPFQFLVYTVIDNVITFFKAGRQIWVNFQHLSNNIHDYKRVEPEAKEAIKIPRIQVKSDIMGITLENDEFESQLSLIFQFGAIENVERRRKLAVFEKKAEFFRSQAREALSNSHVEQRRFVSKGSHKRKPNVLTKALFNTQDDKEQESTTKHAKKSSLRETFCGSENHTETDEHKPKSTKMSMFKDAFSGNDSKKSGSDSSKHTSGKGSVNDTQTKSESQPEQIEEYMTEDEVEGLIAKAYGELLQDFSDSWVNKFAKFKHTSHQSWKSRMESIWGSDTVNKVMKSKFEIQEYSRGPPQFQGAFRDFDLIVDDPKLEDIDGFLAKHGKGQPHLDYSILIPAYIHWRSSSVYMSLRDYALPFMSFPSSGDPDSPVMDLRGTIVINERLVQIPEELRHIFVPFSPATKASRIVDNFYSVSVIRTLTPVKMMFDLESTLSTDRACVISWCKAYQPALSSAMMAFENFTKPEIDDSPLGWWDKMALNAHGSIRFMIKNELCLHMKSSISPYSLIGNSSGLVFCWKDNVRLRINDTGKQSELVILESDDFILGIPNYSATEGQAWSLLNSNANNDNSDSESEMGKFQKRVMKLTSDEKVVWKLGFLFERNKDKDSKELSADMERTDQFKPHYDVIMTGPQYDYHPDSFEEFRSDYTHLAISVNSSSKKGNSHNYAYFTPLTFEYFKVWWKTLNDNVSLPIREGKLFAKSAFKDSSVKFGPHLFTLKYQLVIEPLTVSDIYLSMGDKDSNHNVTAYGCKGKAAKCVIDLHQRREIARYVNENLGIDKQVRKLKMNLGEVEVTEADIRLIFASFNDISMAGKLLSYYSGETSSAVDLDTYEKDLKEHSARNQSSRRGLVANESDMPWIDFDDFIEMEEHEILSPDTTVKVVPFFSTPSFTYFRESTSEHPEGIHPFGHEPSHKCLIGVSSPEEIQAQLVELRSTEVKLKLNEYLKKAKKLSENHDSASSREKHRLDKEIAHWQKKVKSLGQLQVDSECSSTCIDEVTNVNTRTTSRNGSLSEIKPQMSHALSMYSVISSLDQAREVINANSMLSSYHNRFLIHNLKMKWNNEARDVFTSFLSVMGHRRTEALSMSRQALELMDKLLKNAEQKKRQSVGEPSFVSEKNFTCGNDVIEAFDEYLTRLECDTEEIDPKYIVKFIKPQIQFQSDSNPGACVLMTSRDIELRVFCVNHEGTDDIITDSDVNTSLMETRYGVLCRDSRVLAFQEAQFADSSSKSHGADQKRSNWPPWLNLEDSDNLQLFEKNLVIEKTTIAVSLKKPNLLAVETCKGHPQNSEVVVHLAKLVINATSEQYCAFYYILTDLLIHGNEKHYFLQRIEQISSVSEASDFANLADRIKLLQNNIRICKFLILKMNEKSLKLSEEKQRQHSHLKLELCRMKIELTIIIKSLEVKSSSFNGIKAMSRAWSVHVDQLIFHILEDSREPLIDFALATSTFTRLEESDGSNANSVEVSLVQGFNLKKGAAYPELLRPFKEFKGEKGKGPAYDESSSMIKMKWKMLNPVGGIRVMNNADLSVQPLQVQLDYDTATQLFDYLFPKDEDTQDGSETRERSSSMDVSESEAEYDSSGSPPTINSPTKTFKKVWNRSKISRSDSSSNFTHDSSRHDTFSGETMSASSSEGRREQEVPKVKHGGRKRGKEEKTITDDIAIIMRRSAQYFVVGDFKVNKMNLCISFKAPKHLNIIDVHNLEFFLPSIHYKDKTWTSNDFIMQLQKDVIKIFLSNTVRIIGNKFKVRKRKKVSTPLRQISDFSSYMTLEDLQGEGRGRDSVSPVSEKSEQTNEGPSASHRSPASNDNPSEEVREWNGLENVDEEIESDSN